MMTCGRRLVLNWFGCLWGTSMEEKWNPLLEWSSALTAVGEPGGGPVLVSDWQQVGAAGGGAWH